MYFACFHQGSSFEKSGESNLSRFKLVEDEEKNITFWYIFFILTAWDALNNLGVV